MLLCRRQEESESSKPPPPPPHELDYIDLEDSNKNASRRASIMAVPDMAESFENGALPPDVSDKPAGRLKERGTDASKSWKWFDQK